MTTVNRWGKSVSSYWGSPLNKWIGLNCPHDFTCINIDCLELKFESKTIRFIEYKHNGEPLGNQQKKALKTLASLLSKSQIDSWKFEVCVIQGNEPFEKLNVYEYPSEKLKVISGFQEIKKYLSLEVVQ